MNHSIFFLFPAKGLRVTFEDLRAISVFRPTFTKWQEHLYNVNILHAIQTKIN